MPNLLQQGIEVYKSGKKEEARKIFISFVKENPQSERGWEWMYHVSQTGEERIYCLQQVLHINPGNKKAEKLLNEYLGQSSPISIHSQNGKPRKDRSRAHRNRANTLVIGGLAVLSLLGFCVVFAILSSQVVDYNNSARNN